MRPRSAFVCVSIPLLLLVACSSPQPPKPRSMPTGPCGPEALMSFRPSRGTVLRQAPLGASSRVGMRWDPPKDLGGRAEWAVREEARGWGIDVTEVYPLPTGALDLDLECVGAVSTKTTLVAASTPAKLAAASATATPVRGRPDPAAGRCARLDPSRVYLWGLLEKTSSDRGTRAIAPVDDATSVCRGFPADASLPAMRERDGALVYHQASDRTFRRFDPTRAEDEIVGKASCADEIRSRATWLGFDRESGDLYYGCEIYDKYAKEYAFALFRADGTAMKLGRTGCWFSSPLAVRAGEILGSCGTGLGLLDTRSDDGLSLITEGPSSNDHIARATRYGFLFVPIATGRNELWKIDGVRASKQLDYPAPSGSIGSRLSAIAHDGAVYLGGGDVKVGDKWERVINRLDASGSRVVYSSIDLEARGVPFVRIEGDARLVSGAQSAK